MQVILTEKIRNLGNLGDTVKVKAGYARNFLLPQGKALAATAGNLADLEAHRVELEKKAKAAQAEAQTRADAIEKLDDITLKAQASEEGKLFGSIGTREIAEAVEAAGCHIDKAEVTLSEGALRALGEFEIALQLHSEVIAHIKLHVVAEGSE